MNRCNNLSDRTALITHARNVLDEAVGAWQRELALLNGMLQSLCNAESANKISCNSEAARCHSEVRTTASNESGRGVIASQKAKLVGTKVFS
jgi:hypothetical protein